tara:strand:+ start:13115 stop:14776 length:1662 start_codon:yes stop_codon:yes gene_type:complete
MELTIEQALQQGVSAFKEGKLQDAERLYRTILQSKQAHPDANYNLGVIAVCLNKSDAALPYFKTALEANPRIEQFWLSYIDALIKTKQFDNAKQVLCQAKMQGVDSLKLNSLEVQISHKNQKLNPAILSPPQEQLKSLLEYYQKGQFGYAEKLARSISEEFPKHHFSWKVLGAILGAIGKNSEAINACQTAVALSPQDAEAHSNLGNILKEIGKLDESLLSFNKAIALKPDFDDAFNNMGNVFQDQDKMDKAIVAYRKAISLNPKHAEAYYNLGTTFQELGKLEDAEATLYQAIAVNPDHIKAHNQLLTCLFTQDKKLAFFEELDYLINHDVVSSVIGSLVCRSYLKYGIEKSNLFCTKPLNYVLHNDLKTKYDFKKIFIETAKYMLNENQISNRTQNLLVNGNQTSGNIFNINDDAINEIENIIRLEIEKYRLKFRESDEGLIKKMPAEYNLFGWLISMKSGGNIKPHIHTEGWLSGSIYINVPQKLKNNAGNLIVALGDDKDTIDTFINEKKIINVVTGSMVLFPASLMHSTIPFESNEERIVLAFDMKEK